ncbi:MAG: DUF1730 domain-containing protein, partial [Candidatus Sericytochromatia bacterium]|nr:DUF1730 domain-containing protein [Candidatus Sericytochromatia bacterium]
MLTTKQIISQKIKDYAKELGFDLVGITSSQPLDIDFYQSWIEKGFAGEMEYLKRNIDKRENPELLFEGTKSIVCLGFNYYTESNQSDYKVAKYALGDDYHFFLK